MRSLSLGHRLRASAFKHFSNPAQVGGTGFQPVPRAKRAMIAKSLASFGILALLAACSSSNPRLSAVSSDAPDWPTPRADRANTGRSLSVLPGPPYASEWSVKTGGIAASEPIIRNGLIFFSGCDRRVEVYDLATGERLWRKRFDGPVLGVNPTDTTLGVLTDLKERRYLTFNLQTGEEMNSFRTNGSSAPPRRLDDTTIVLVNWSGHVRAVTDSGKTRWDSECKGPIKNAPSLVGSVLYVTGGRMIFALSVTNGTKLWEHRLTGNIEGAPAVDDQVYVGAADSVVTALDPNTGTPVWSTRLTGGVFTTPVIGDSLLYVSANDGSVTALLKRDGAIIWTFASSAVANLSPTLCGEFLLTTSRHSVLSVLKGDNGQLLWSEKVLTGQASTPPIVVGDRIIVTDADRNLVCLRPAALIQASSSAKD